MYMDGSVYQAIAERSGQRGKLQPDVKSRHWWHHHLKSHFRQARQDMVPLVIEMFLERNL